MKLKTTTKSPKGFSLVATISMMVLLTMVAIGLLGLATVQVRSVEASRDREMARANARLAMMMALGELQKTLGPDQRVSVPAAQLDTNESTLDIDGVAQPHWVNVFRTTLENGEPVIQRSLEEGGLSDLRESGDWKADNDQLACLVSGNEAGLVYTEVGGQRLPGGNMVSLVGNGTVGDSGQLRKATVEAPLVALYENEDEEDPAGHYAWWVGDLGVKANVATPDAFGDNAGTLANKWRLQLAQDSSITADNFGSELTNQDRSLLVTPNQLGLHFDDTDRVKEYYHDFTTDSMGVLANTREGGLKGDLTNYFSGSGSIADLDTDEVYNLGLQDTDNIIGPRNLTEDALSSNPGEAERLQAASPRFALLREWFRRSDTNQEGQIALEMENPETRASTTVQRSYYGLNNKVARYTNRETNDISPVLTEGSIYYNLSYYNTGQASPRAYHMRLHLYPRVSLWNPYNVEMEVPASMIQLFINGGKQIEVFYDPPYTVKVPQFFGPDLEVTLDRVRYDMWWGDSGGATRGRLFFMMDPVTIEPGETVVFSPAQNTQYDLATYSNNRLTPERSPDPSRSFYMDERDDSRPLFDVAAAAVTNQPLFVDDHLLAPPTGWREFVDPLPLGNIQEAGYTQADDYFMYWKPITSSISGNLTRDRFANLPHGQFVSCAFQYGDEDELPLEWSYDTTVPFPVSDKTAAICPTIPDRRTRDGFRLRWFDEHYSNRIGGGSLAGTAHMETASIANWNLRTSYSFRGPFDNVSDVAPHFFGNYTRDLFDENISWTSMSPTPQKGKFLSDPFQASNQGNPRRILFDVPRRDTKILSLGALQHVKFSELPWSPTYAFGNSLADPRVPLNKTEPPYNEGFNSDEGGWNKDTIGYSDDGRSVNNNGGASDQNNWAYTVRGYIEDFMLESNVTFDLSYELNHAMWDRYFLSTGNTFEKQSFIEDPTNNPLPNGRLRNVKDKEIASEDIIDYHRAASTLMMDGAFNVNSTSATAWEALLLSTLGVGFDEDVVTFPRILDLTEGAWDGEDPWDEGAWAGQRTVTRTQIRELAEAIVAEVKNRGPFLSLADFVNRRLADDATGLKGTLQAAIDNTSINRTFNEEYPLDNTQSLPNYTHDDNIRDPTRLEQTSKPQTTAWGALGFLTQADVLQVIGHNLTARSDTFVIRSYGNATDRAGNVTAEAWCEATVQRTTEPVHPDEHLLNPSKDVAHDFGRKFKITRFRWLSQDEV
ncbi:MAG: hypothetical protein Q7Q71_11085 [Verrucomicrobiota bacterium JB023]|nr:hypothetical protein [Verrucomicrobiota bacterium JB023]